jgi:large subunit ribosomal protein L18
MINSTRAREDQRIARHARVRNKMIGTTERPRLCVHRSHKNLFAQVVNDVEGKVICGLSTMNKDVKKKTKDGGNVAAAAVLGEAVAKIVVQKGIKQVCFDRGGYMYHGRVKAFVESVRKGGVDF